MKPRELTRVLDQLRRAGGGRLSLPWLGLGLLLLGLWLWLQPVSRPRADHSPAAPHQEPGVQTAGSPQRATPAPGLRDAGDGVLVSPAGLRYSPGSRHGHRWDHVLAHAVDQPRRPGSHGVFEPGDPASVVDVIDNAFRQAQLGERTVTRQERGRTVHTVELGQRIGYVGGRTGQARGHPDADTLRLVLEGNRVITAFPVD